ncbi:MAG: hypothetical protein MRY72_05130, partial [Aquisalinus sp.]|nr:hypothetical protein [Aquisalinus sp.]
FTGAFTRGNGAEDAFYKQLTYITPDERFVPLLEACGVAPDSEAPEYEIFDARYTDHEGYQYDPAFSIRLASQGNDGDIFVEGLSYPLETLDIKVSGLSYIMIKSTAEDVSGASWAFGPDGYAFETHGFAEMNVERKIFCADAVSGAEFISNFADTYSAGHTTYPLRYSVTFQNNGPENGGHDTEGMCNYMYDDAKQIIKEELEYYDIQPKLQMPDAPDNDLRLTLIESENTDPYAKNECKFDIDVDAAWTDNLNPLPARNQNYETGFELIYQGMIQIAVSFREHAKK